MKLKNKFLAVLLMSILLLQVAGCGADKKAQSIDVSATANWLQETVSEPYYGSVGGEWLVFGLARSSEEVSEEYYLSYYDTLASIVKENEGILDEYKYTEYSRVIIALTAIGKDPTNVEGYNLLNPLADFENVIYQGMNGPIYALLALDSGNYEIPNVSNISVQATREMYVDYILNNEADNGGWGMTGGKADVDITAMALQALAKYQDRQDVADATERALDFLSDMQNENGGYISFGTENSETISQVIVALTELGIDIKDSRFVKKGNSLTDALLTFRTEEGAFLHTLESDANLMATEQAFYALVALDRAEKQESSLYRITN